MQPHIVRSVRLTAEMRIVRYRHLEFRLVQVGRFLW